MIPTYDLEVATYIYSVMNLKDQKFDFQCVSFPIFTVAKLVFKRGNRPSAVA